MGDGCENDRDHLKELVMPKTADFILDRLRRQPRHEETGAFTATAKDEFTGGIECCPAASGGETIGTSDRDDS